MKKLTVLSVLGAFAVILETSVFAVHPGSATSAQQTPTMSEQTVQATPTQVVKSPWAVSVLLDMLRSNVRGLDKAPMEHLTNTTYVSVSRSILENTNLKLTVPFINTFLANTKQIGIRQYLDIKDPVVALVRPKLYEVWGISGSGDLRVSLPVTPNSRLNDDVSRNPNYGHYRYTVTAGKDIGKWSFSALNLGRFNNYLRSASSQGLNHRYDFIVELGAAYNFTDQVALSSVLDMNYARVRQDYTPDRSTDLGLSLDLKPVANMEVSASASMSFPDQTLKNYFIDEDSKLDNTSAGLSISYKFL